MRRRQVWAANMQPVEIHWNAASEPTDWPSPEEFTGGPITVSAPRNECPNCGRQFKDRRGIAKHIAACVG